MKLYKINSGIVIQNNNTYRLLKEEDWDSFVNDDTLADKILKILENDSHHLEVGPSFVERGLLAPVGKQEVWASGVTYLRSKTEREKESQVAGGNDFYRRIYEAERPELFFKSTPDRVIAHNDFVSIRKDSTWNVPEPELTLLITSGGKIVGYTIGNDMSSRSIEGENPLYLPQAKVYDGSTSIGPCIYVFDKQYSLSGFDINLEIVRNNRIVFNEKTDTKQMKRSFEELVSYLFREISFPYGCFLMTGTGIVPPENFSLKVNDIIKIEVDPIGVLINIVK